MSAPHGFELAPEDHRLLRARPPAAALDWVAGEVGSGARVVSVRAPAGGTSSAVHVVMVERPDGRRRRLVLRRFVRADWLAEEPDLADHEAAALRLLAGGQVSAPELVAVDPTGEHAGVPAVLMTALPGRIDWSPRDLDSWLDRLVAVLPVVHDTPLPDHSGLPPYQPYDVGVPLDIPKARRALARAFEVYGGPQPSNERRLIHRDYHPGNVLWRRGRVTGVIDWVNASVGSPLADVGHIRANLAGHFDQQVAGDFLARYQALTGSADYHPYWDIVAALDFRVVGSDEPDTAMEEFVARAVARLT